MTSVELALRITTGQKGFLRRHGVEANAVIVCESDLPDELEPPMDRVAGLLVIPTPLTSYHWKPRLAIIDDAYPI